MAVDIALHHECLRASLKKCKGYEIATEGDSFKCAFRTPEDAICWSIVAQVRLPPGCPLASLLNGDLMEHWRPFAFRPN